MDCTETRDKKKKKKRKEEGRGERILEDVYVGSKDKSSGRGRRIPVSRDSFSARCHRHTNQMRLYWDCQTVRISIRMLVGRTERRTHAGENERNRKQTSEGKSRRSGSGRRTDTAIFFFFSMKFFSPSPSSLASTMTSREHVSIDGTEPTDRFRTK